MIFSPSSLRTLLTSCLLAGVVPAEQLIHFEGREGAQIKNPQVKGETHSGAKAENAPDAEKNSAKKVTKVVFMDETKITGTIHSIDGTNGSLEFTSPSLAGKNTLKTARLLDLELALEHEAPEAGHYALATIKPRYNEEPPQDTIRGSFVGIDADHITLDTWYAGQLRLKRSMVQGLAISENSPRLFNGPASLEGWTGSDSDVSKNWSFKQRSFISKGNGSIARKVEMPEKFKLSVQIAWKASPYFKIGFLSSSHRDTYSNRGYTLQVQTSYVSLNRTGKDRQRNDLFSESIQSFREQEKGTFEFYLNRTSGGKNAFYIDGKQITNWESQDDLKGLGEWLMFSSSRSQSIKISNIAISQWDGQLPFEENKDADVQTMDIFKGLSGQRINLANGDAIVGEVTKVADAIAVLKTDLGELSVPITRLRSFGLDSKDDKPRMYGKDVRAWFTEGGSVTLRLDAITPERVRGYSQVFGEAEFDLRAFSRIEFNIWSPERENFEQSEDW